jgi:protein-tyrosine-phosphatase
MGKNNECPIKRILFVDDDNMFESAVAEAIAQFYADLWHLDITVSSAGIDAKEGERRSSEAYQFNFDFDEMAFAVMGIQALKYHWILRGTTRELTSRRLADADLVVVLYSRDIDDVKVMMPRSMWHKIVPFHLYCMHSLHGERVTYRSMGANRDKYSEFHGACSTLITRMASYSYYETVIQYNLEGLRQSFIQQYQQQLVDGFTDKEVMVNTNHCKLFVDGDIWLRLVRYDSASYSLDIMIKDEHNSSNQAIIVGSLDKIRQALYSETFARDYALVYADCEKSFERLLSDPR